MKIKISPHLSFPIEVVTQTIGILAKKRAGKSYTARRLTEQLLKANQQVVIVDPKGDWWGIRSSKDGKTPGLPVIILGGEHGDVPLESGAGEMVARLVIEERVSILLDLSNFRKNEIPVFMTSFMETLYRMKNQEQYRTPMAMIVDEADVIAPQKPFHGEERMLGAIEDIVRRGGQRGIGLVMITQRSAVLNKNVLTQIQILITLRTIAPQDLAAMNAWIDVHGTQEERKTLMSSLPSLPTGDAWVWSPGWPDNDGIFQRVHIAPIETFDSGATPKPGEKRIEPKNLADIDIGKLAKQMQATIEKAKENNPALLKKQINELKAELKKKSGAATTITKIVDEKAIERAVNNAKIEINKQYQALLREREAEIKRLTHIVMVVSKAIGTEFKPKELSKLAINIPENIHPVHKPAQINTQTAHFVTRKPVINTVDGEFKLNATQQRIIDAIAWYESMGNMAPTLVQIGAVALIDPTGGHFSNTVGPLSTYGLIERTSGTMRLTAEGRALAQPIEAVTSLDGYHEVLRQRVRKMKSAGGKTIEMLNVIIAAGGNSIATEELGEAVGIDHTGGHFSNMIGPLSTAGLIKRANGIVTPTNILFPEGL